GASRKFVMKGVTLAAGFDSFSQRFLPAFAASSCAGSIHLEDVVARVTPPGPGLGIRGAYTEIGMDFSACAAVTLGRCRANGSPALHAATSTIAVHSSVLTGNDGVYFFTGYIQSADAVELESTNFTMAAASAIAGTNPGLSDARAAIISGSSTLVLGANSAL